ncbi:MAG TPA: amidase [Candidatus Binataceae bacterium]|nr:amidase [Candidatus Binataceae bacterium]
MEDTSARLLNPYIGAVELRELVLKRKVRPREVAEFFLARIERLNPKLGAYMTITAERALDDARRLEKIKPAEARKLPLYGVPYSIKDLTYTKGIRTTLGSKNFENYVPEVDSEIAIRLRNSGGILLGKTSTPEFGNRPTTEGGLCPPARNPWNLEHTAGGSSGGAACAAASGMSPVAHGTDGGGSVRIPAACCGIVGIKASRARISMAPLAGEGWGGMSTSGPLARSVRDAALLLDVLAGPKVGDPYAAWPPSKPFVEALKRRPKKLKLAAISNSALGGPDEETRANFESVCRMFRKLGHSVTPLDLDPGTRLNPYARILVSAGTAAREVPNPELLDPMVRGTWDYGRTLMAHDYVTALTGMHNTAREIVQALNVYDATLLPTLTRPAPRLGAMPSGLGETAVREIYGWIPFTFPFNATGQPSIALPTGFSKAGLPLSVQIVGRQNDEEGIIALAAQFEREHPWADKLPSLE